MSIISPSVLACNFTKLTQQIKEAEEAGAKWLHYDVMDGHFVPNISFGPSILNDISGITDLFLDVHLMISDPFAYYKSFVKAGADLITFHYEVFTNDKDILEMIHAIKESGVQVGISINPMTPYEVILPFVKEVDVILLMSVQPGFGGQTFDLAVVEKIKALKEYIQVHSYSVLLEVDGGINKETNQIVKDAGIDVVVAGSYIFNSSSIKDAVDSLR